MIAVVSPLKILRGGRGLSTLPGDSDSWRLEEVRLYSGFEVASCGITGSTSLVSAAGWASSTLARGICGGVTGCSVPLQAPSHALSVRHNKAKGAGY